MDLFVPNNFAGKENDSLYRNNGDGTFLKVTTGPVVNDGVNTFSASWADYDNDEDLDLFVAGHANLLYRNDGGESFERMTDVPFLARSSSSGAWGDYDNDGDLDLFVVNWPSAEPNFLYENVGGGSFTRIDSGVVVKDPLPTSPGGNWVDYDDDGWLDLYVSTWGGHNDALYRNNLSHWTGPDDSFVRVTESPVVQETTSGSTPSWSDIEGDGELDLFVNTSNASDEGTKPSLLFRNDGEQGFLKIVEHPLVQHQADSNYAIWGDVDNDGDFDLFVGNQWEPNFLFRNDGDWNFTKINEGRVIEDDVVSGYSHWVDYDNDGDLDLFVANGFVFVPIKDSLYRNDGGGHFTAVTSGSLVNEPSQTVSSWVDFDNDGFLDLFKTTIMGPDDSPTTRLFRNNLGQVGSGNHWIKIRCVGTHANRSGIGAKIRVQATIGGSEQWQLRMMGGGDAQTNGSLLPVHFGLGDAETIDTIRIEWPGPAFTVQELHDVPVNQVLKVIEPPQLSAQWDGAVELRVPGWTGTTYRLEVSADLVSWEPLATLTVTDPARGVGYRDDESHLAGQRF